MESNIGKFQVAHFAFVIGEHQNKPVLMASLTYNLKKYLRFIVKKPSVLAQVLPLKEEKHFAFLKATLIGFKNSLLSYLNFSVLNYN